MKYKLLLMSIAASLQLHAMTIGSFLTLVYLPMFAYGLDREKKII